MASERRLRALVGAIDEIVFELDAEGTYVGIWARDEKLLAHQPAELLGRRIPEALGEEVGRPFVDTIHRVLSSGRSEVFEYSLEVRAGRRWFLASVSPVPAAEGRAPTAVMIARDVTARKRLEEDLRQAQKMEAVGTLAGGVAHEFNNLLTIILGYTQLLLQSPGGPEGMREDLQQIERAAGRAAELTRQLLALGRRQMLEPKVVDLGSILRATEEMLRTLIGERIELVSSYAPGLGRVHIDPGQITLVVVELVQNACDAMPRGGTLTLATGAREVPASAASESSIPPGKYVSLSIGDTGSGMDEATKSRIFEPFFTSKPLGRGPGLGLATVLGVIEQSGGQIRVESTPGLGTTFEILLPWSEARPEPGLSAG